MALQLNYKKKIKKRNFRILSCGWENGHDVPYDDDHHDNNNDVYPYCHVVTVHDDGDVMMSCNIDRLYHCCYDDDDGDDDGDCLMTRNGVCVVMNCDHVMMLSVHVNESLCDDHVNTSAHVNESLCDDHVNAHVSLCNDHVNAHMNGSLCDGVKKSDASLSYMGKDEYHNTLLGKMMSSITWSCALYLHQVFCLHHDFCLHHPLGVHHVLYR